MKTKIELIKDANSFLKDSLSRCVICPRKCGVDRASGKRGYCRAGMKPTAYSFLPHHGEEPPISASRGSGTIFFSYCNMKCVYCQNYTFSQLDSGIEMSPKTLASVMMRLQREGCHNINLVSPTHFVPQILLALEIAIENGLKIPIVYNTGGYESLETLRAIAGIVDIYLPDMRYSDNGMGKKYSDAVEYCDYNRPAVKEMHRQVGDLIMDENGLAQKGLIIRLLVLPENASGTVSSLEFIRDKISPKTYLSIMSQYFPAFRSCEYPELSRRVTRGEYENVVDAAKKMMLNNGWIQEMPSENDTTFFGTTIRPRKPDQNIT